jgi:hypothetical protein
MTVDGERTTEMRQMLEAQKRIAEGQREMDELLRERAANLNELAANLHAQGWLVRRSRRVLYPLLLALWFLGATVGFMIREVVGAAL